MLRVTICIVLLVSAFVTAREQKPSSPVQDSAPAKLPVIRLQDGSISGLGPIYSHGTGFWIAATDSAAILASAEELKDVFAVAIAIRNTSKEAFTFDPSEVKAFDIISGKYLNVIPASKLANKMRSPNAWGRFAQGFSRGAALANQDSSQQSTTTLSGDFSGQTYSGVLFRGTFDATAVKQESTCNAACVQARTNLLASFAEQDVRRVQKADAVETLGLAKETLAPMG